MAGQGVSINSEASADVRFDAHYGLKSDIARGPKSANRLGLSIMPEIPLSAGQLVSFIASGNNRSAKLVVEQRRDILRRDGLTEQIALSLSTSIGFEICQLTGVFHTLSSGC